MPNQTFNDGVHNHYYHPPQQSEFQFENRDAIIPIRFYQKEKDIISEIAKRRGKSNSDFCRDIVLKFLKSEKSLAQMRQLLDDILI